MKIGLDIRGGIGIISFRSSNVRNSYVTDDIQTYPLMGDLAFDARILKSVSFLSRVGYLLQTLPSVPVFTETIGIRNENTEINLSSLIVEVGLGFEF